ncbi:MAG TPA: phosphoenolpyruvate kinase [Candidatus Limnocylindria bacterium]|nr:phosphoenolpyruvate kinase [Candidatus Limnocylindria bacterium]
MTTTFDDRNLRDLIARLSQANRTFAEAYPGERPDRQPVHTVYGGAHLFSADLMGKLGASALRALEEYAPDPATFATALGAPAGLAGEVYGRVLEKLRREPVEDFRLDFEDGYGNRPWDEEDGHAENAASEVAAGLTRGALPPFIGIRIKPLNEELRERSFRTLDRFVTSLVRATGGRLPDHFVVTLPKVTHPEQVEALVDALEILERALDLALGSLRLELMVETAQSILDRRGGIALPSLVAAARGRCRGAHFGTYDYTAGLNITAAHQVHTHPACDFARHVMQVSLAGTGVTLSDGATTLMPVGPHRPRDGEPLTREQRDENRRTVHHAWRRHYEDVRSSLIRAFYQGWDLNPAQLPSRYAAVFSFFLEGRNEAAVRLRAFIDRAAQATLVGNVFDDAATGQGLLNFFLRGLNCGALTESEALEAGLGLEELRGRSFVKILDRRRAAADQLPR